MKFLNITLRIILTAVFLIMASVTFAESKNKDGEIIAYMQAINNSEINTSKVTKDKKVTPAVMKYADMMIEQHGENLQRKSNLFKIKYC